MGTREITTSVTRLEGGMLRCPMCGGPGYLARVHQAFWQPGCLACPLVLESPHGDPEKAVEEWNRRVAPTAADGPSWARFAAMDLQYRKLHHHAETLEKQVAELRQELFEAEREIDEMEAKQRGAAS